MLTGDHLRYPPLRAFIVRTFKILIRMTTRARKFKNMPHIRSMNIKYSNNKWICLLGLDDTFPGI